MSGYSEPAGFRQDLNVSGEEALDLGIKHSRELFKRFCFIIIPDGETTADIEYLYLMPARFRFPEDLCRELQRLHIILEIIALAADVKADTLND